MQLLLEIQPQMFGNDYKETETNVGDGGHKSASGTEECQEGKNSNSGGAKESINRKLFIE